VVGIVLGLATATSDCIYTLQPTLVLLRCRARLGQALPTAFIHDKKTTFKDGGPLDADTITAL
jgi:hypothetical protein